MTFVILLLYEVSRFDYWMFPLRYTSLNTTRHVILSALCHPEFVEGSLNAKH